MKTRLKITINLDAAAIRPRRASAVRPPTASKIRGTGIPRHNNYTHIRIQTSDNVGWDLLKFCVVFTIFDNFLGMVHKPVDRLTTE